MLWVKRSKILLLVYAVIRSECHQFWTLLNQKTIRKPQYINIYTFLNIVYLQNNPYFRKPLAVFQKKSFKSSDVTRTFSYWWRYKQASTRVRSYYVLVIIYREHMYTNVHVHAHENSQLLRLKIRENIRHGYEILVSLISSSLFGVSYDHWKQLPVLCYEINLALELLGRFHQQSAKCVPGHKWSCRKGVSIFPDHQFKTITQRYMQQFSLSPVRLLPLRNLKILVFWGCNFFHLPSWSHQDHSASCHPKQIENMMTWITTTGLYGGCETCL